MEKIYMDDNNNQKNQNQSQKGKYHFSIVLSFIVAVMAIASLVVVGFDQISYAADTPNLGDSFTLGNVSENNKQISVEAGSSGSTFKVYLYQTNNNIPVFCIQQMIAPGIGEDYNKGDEITDDGILYILNKSAVYGGDGIISKSDIGSDSDTNYKYMESYATQVALWLHLYKEGDSEHDLARNNRTGSVNKGILEGATEYSINVGSDAADSITISDSEKKVATKILAVVAAANDPKNKVKETNVWFDDKNLSEIDGSDYYQTSAINVSGKPSDDLESYSLSLYGVDGAFFVDENGEKLKDEELTSIVPNSKKMYVRIPKDKVSSEAKTLTVTARGTFKNYLTGTKYVSDGSQTVVTVTSDKHVVPGEAQLLVVGAPDTGMSKAKTIYFIGLIVLLCGVGIIYASSKPIKEN